MVTINLSLVQSRPSDEEFVLDELKEDNVKSVARKSRPGTSSSSEAPELIHKGRDSGQKKAAACSEAQASSKGAGAAVQSAAHSSSGTKVAMDKRALNHARLCLVCRQYFAQDQLLRLTAESTSGSVVLNQAQRGTARVCGRSAYVCCSLSCVEAALKGTRLKQALQGRKLKGAPQKRSVAWPLESQLIHTMRTKCTESVESCQNTLRKEGL